MGQEYSQELLEYWISDTKEQEKNEEQKL